MALLLNPNNNAQNLCKLKWSNYCGLVLQLKSRKEYNFTINVNVSCQDMISVGAV